MCATGYNMSSSTETTATTLRVCSYNIHKGFNTSNTQYLLKDIRRAIRLINADLVFLQEVVGENTLKSGSESQWEPGTQFEFLADTVWPHHAYGKNAVYSHGHHGNAILSRYPIEHWENTDISILPFSSRGVLHVKILNKLHVFCIHCGLLSFERQAQLQQLVTLIQSRVEDNAPLILAGDFNDWRNKASDYLQAELGVAEVFTSLNGQPAITFPAFFPLFSLDRIYFRGLTPVDSEVLTGTPWRSLSDHCAVYAEFSLPG